jgi:Uma2 family endonuclease
MGNPAKRRATYEDILAVPENMIAEILDGELVTQARPGAPHTSASSVLGGELHPFRRNRGPGGWVILDEPELHLGPDVLVPDLAGWRRERMPHIPMEKAAFDLAPDWVCEVLSAGTAARDRTQKRAIYGRERVSYVWLLDPVTRTLEVLRLEGARYLLIDAWREDAVVRAEPFDSIELELAALWAD